MFEEHVLALQTMQVLLSKIIPSKCNCNYINAQKLKPSSQLVIKKEQLKLNWKQIPLITQSENYKFPLYDG